MKSLHYFAHKADALFIRIKNLRLGYSLFQDGIGKNLKRILLWDYGLKMFLSRYWIICSGIQSLETYEAGDSYKDQYSYKKRCKGHSIWFYLGEGEDHIGCKELCQTQVGNFEGQLNTDA